MESIPRGGSTRSTWKSLQNRDRRVRDRPRRRSSHFYMFFWNSFRPRIIFSPTLKNFLGPDSPFCLLAKHRSVSQKLTAHSFKTECFTLSYLVYAGYALYMPYWSTSPGSFLCLPS